MFSIFRQIGKKSKKTKKLELCERIIKEQEDFIEFLQNETEYMSSRYKDSLETAMLHLETIEKSNNKMLDKLIEAASESTYRKNTEKELWQQKEKFKERIRELEMDVSNLECENSELKHNQKAVVRSKAVDLDKEIFKRYGKIVEEKAAHNGYLDHFEHLVIRYKMFPMTKKVERINGAYKRADYQKALHNDLDDLKWKKIQKRFDNKCALSKTTNDVTLEHFIPLNTGHGGTYEGNVFPLNASLNASKNNRNPFYWFSKNDFPVHFSLEAWDDLITYLAEKNNLTVEEYIHFVNWCFENPRTLEDIEGDGDISSIELWENAIKNNNTEKSVKIS